MEQWKDIPGYEGLYQASDHGRVRTCEGKITSNARFSRRVWKQRILKQKIRRRKSGHGADARVTIWKDGKESTKLVSRLVAMTWCEGYADGLTVNHIDGDPTNNHAGNLEWVTHGENIRKGFETQLYGSQKAITLIDDKGHERSFRSMSSASRYLGMCNGYISGLLSKGITHTSSGMKIIAE